MDDHGYGEDQATLGDRLTVAREAASLSIDEAASRLGVRIETMTGWEADQAEPRASLLGRLSGIYGVPLVWLLSGEGTAPGPAAEGAAARVAAMQTELRELRRLLGEASERADRLAGMLTDG